MFICDFKFRRTVESNLQFKKMAPQLYRRKHKERPKLPLDCLQIKSSFQNTSILNKYGYTLDKKSKMYVDTFINESHAFCIFQSQSVIDMVKNEFRDKDRIYMLDGTFKTAARPFTQLLTISIQFRNDVSFTCIE